MSVKLYSHWKSSCSWRVRIALALKAVKYEYECVNLFDNDDLERLEKINPLRQIPAISHDDTNFTQSVAIVEYINEAFPGFQFFPDDIKLKAKTRAICEIINSGIQPLQTLSVIFKVPEVERSEWAEYWIKNGLKALEIVLLETSGKYCVGDEVTAADIFLAPQVANAVHRFDVEMIEFPVISRIYSALTTHEAFVQAHPFQQPDAPEGAKL